MRSSIFHFLASLWVIIPVHVPTIASGYVMPWRVVVGGADDAGPVAPACRGFPEEFSAAAYATPTPPSSTATSTPITKRRRRLPARVGARSAQSRSDGTTDSSAVCAGKVAADGRVGDGEGFDPAATRSIRTAPSATTISGVSST